MVGTDNYDRLSALGQRQSRLLARTLADRGIRPRLILSGGLIRQRETAEILREMMSIDQPSIDQPDVDSQGGIDPRWNEFDYRGAIVAARPDYADRAVQRADLARYPDPVAAFNDVFTEATARWLGGSHDEHYAEPFPDFLVRVEAALAATLAQLDDGEIALVVTSAGVISTLAAVLLDGGTLTWQRINACLANTGFTSVVASSAPQLLTLNEHPHLDIGEPDLLTYR